MAGLVSHTAFLIATWIAAIFGGIGIGAAFISAIIGYQLTEESVADANEKIAASRERTAGLEKQTTELKIALEKERAKRARRTLPDDKIEILANALRRSMQKLQFVIMHEDDPEVAEYKEEFERAATKAGIEHSAWSGPDGRVWYGLDIFLARRSSLDDVENDPLYTALKKAEVPIGQVFLVQPASVPDSRFDPGVHTIWIGRKPIPKD